MKLLDFRVVALCATAVLVVSGASIANAHAGIQATTIGAGFDIGGRTKAPTASFSDAEFGEVEGRLLGGGENGINEQDDSLVQNEDTTTSGVLRDSVTGAPIANSCIAYAPVASPGVNATTNVTSDGSWSFTTGQPGPFNVAFFTTIDGDCGQPILPTPVPSWYVNQSLTGTDPSVITPPPGAAAIPGGTSNIVACLGVDTMPTTPCAEPDAVLSGNVVTVNNTPLANVCVVALDHRGPVAMASSDFLGNWNMIVARDFPLVVGFLPGVATADAPCGDSDGPPPAPGVGELQPVFYNDIWINLDDPGLGDDPEGWALARGATLIVGPMDNINACLTTSAGTVVPRPSCAPSGTAVSAELPETGTNLQPAFVSAAVAAIFGMIMSSRARSRRRRRT